MTMLRNFITAFIFAAASLAHAQTVVDSVLTIAAGTKSIKADAYADRREIRKVVFQSPCTVTEIGNYAFMGCTALREIELPKTLVSIGEGAFRECESLEKIVILSGVRKLQKYTFAWCVGLKQVMLPAKLTDIGSGCFAYCESLRDIDFPSTLRRIGDNAFTFCKSLKSVNLPASVNELESYVFAECSSLEEATLPANSSKLGELIFSGCRNLRIIRCGASTPPRFECRSTLFEDTESQMYDKCTLEVPTLGVVYYKGDPSWKLFKRIVGYKPTTPPTVTRNQ